MDYKNMTIYDLYKFQKQLGRDSTKKAFFEKYLPDIKDVENYSVILPEAFRELESFEWVYIDRYLEEGKAYAVNTKALLPPFTGGIKLPSKVV